jgi:glycosyltransferase involved in cell wall biosynthesis
LSAGFLSRRTLACWSRFSRNSKQNGEKFRFLIVGHGGEEAWLRERLPRAEFTGVLRGEALSRAYANMDLVRFPSHTDTFGNVVLEALASGVPAIVTPDGGPRTIVRDGETGRIVPDDHSDPDHHAAMRHGPRAPMPSPPVGTQSLKASIQPMNSYCRVLL